MNTQSYNLCSIGFNPYFRYFMLNRLVLLSKYFKVSYLILKWSKSYDFQKQTDNFRVNV